MRSGDVVALNGFDSGYLRTSHKKIHDYQTTKVSGVTNIWSSKQRARLPSATGVTIFSPKVTPLSRVPFPVIVLSHTARRIWTGSPNLKDKSTWAEEHLPGRTDMKWKLWPHVDQAPTR
jgi:hypothetical protein